MEPLTVGKLKQFLAEHPELSDDMPVDGESA
jgi:hypothetical protein